MTREILHKDNHTTRLYVTAVILFCAMFTACGSDGDFPFPTNPVDKHALPKSTIMLTVTPDPVSAGR